MLYLLPAIWILLCDLGRVRPAGMSSRSRAGRAGLALLLGFVCALLGELLTGAALEYVVVGSGSGLYLVSGMAGVAAGVVAQWRVGRWLIPPPAKDVDGAAASRQDD